MYLDYKDYIQNIYKSCTEMSLANIC